MFVDVRTCARIARVRHGGRLVTQWQHTCTRVEVRLVDILTDRQAKAEPPPTDPRLLGSYHSQVFGWANIRCAVVNAADENWIWRVVCGVWRVASVRRPSVHGLCRGLFAPRVACTAIGACAFVRAPCCGECVANVFTCRRRLAMMLAPLLGATLLPRNRHSTIAYQGQNRTAMSVPFILGRDDARLFLLPTTINNATMQVGTPWSGVVRCVCVSLCVSVCLCVCVRAWGCGGVGA